LQDTFGIKDDNMFRAASGLAGGIGGMHDTCGSLLGACMMCGVTMGRSEKDFGDRDKAMESAIAAGKLYKFYEKEFGSPTCREITRRFGGGVSYDMRVPWQFELAKEAGCLKSARSWRARPQPKRQS
jgi:C_GCAxxG_C_C family probable redox protein